MTFITIQRKCRRGSIGLVFCLAATCGALDGAFEYELHVVAGSGDQVGEPVMQQRNAVVDVLLDCYCINYCNLQLSAGVGVTWLWDSYDHQEALLASIYPSIRLYLFESSCFKPYLFATTGFAYMTERGLGWQQLGGNFTFNDFFGIATYVGREKLWSVGCCWRHISNGDLYMPNDGIDIPLCLMVGRRL